MKLRDKGVYRFDDGIVSLYVGALFVAEPTLHGYALYSVDEWRQPLGDPHLVVDGAGRLLRDGRRTGYTVEVLVDTGATAPPTSGSEDTSLDRVARHARRAHLP